MFAPIYHKVFRPDLTTIVVIGHVSAEQARATIEQYFGDWRAEGTKPDTDLPPVAGQQAKHGGGAGRSRVQDNVILAQSLALTRSDPDYYALELGSAVLGGGFYSTRLSIELRKNTGLVYSVGSTLQAGRTRGAYFIHYACDPQNVGKAADIAVQEVRSHAERAGRQPTSCYGSRRCCCARLPLAEASVDGIAHGLIERRELDLPLDEPAIAARHYIELTAGAGAGRIPEVDASRRFRARDAGTAAAIARRRVCDLRCEECDRAAEAARGHCISIAYRGGCRRVRFIGELDSIE